jgi:tetratricopeptide (TPR) repeat protein
MWRAMKMTINPGWLKPRKFLAAALLSVSLLSVSVAMAQEQAQFFATQETGYGRLVISFPGRDTMPPYAMRMSNGVLSLEFEEPISVVLPDVASIMPEYLSVARLDATGKGLRIGLRTTLNFNRTEAGTKLFIDLLPPNWQGSPPALPQDVIDEMNEKAQRIALREDQRRKAQVVAEQNPTVALRIGRNPTFLRLQFDWTIPTGGKFDFSPEHGRIDFEWPVDIDLRDLLTDLPTEIVSAKNSVSLDGSAIEMKFGRDVVPRFYPTGPNQYVLDIDIAGHGLPEFSAAALASEPLAEEAASDNAAGHSGEGGANLAAKEPAITPFVTTLGSTVRVVFPFAQETPSAIFRRGDSVWLLFDTRSAIQLPEDLEKLSAVSREFVVTTMDDAQVVRIDLAEDRLATMGSQGQAWVLSLGDVMMAPTEPLELTRRRDMRGDFEMVANIIRPGRVHAFQDPLVGDTLSVVTAYPPARGITRSLDYVDFSALQSVHGLVIRPKADTLDVSLENALAVITADEGLEVSSTDTLRQDFATSAPGQRASYIDFEPLQQADLGQITKERNALEAAAAASDGRARDSARLDLANFLIANGLSHEALGILRVVGDTQRNEDVLKKVHMSEAVANVMADRPRDALLRLNAKDMDQDIDAMFWRAIARSQNGDYEGARSDATQAYSIIDSYPSWAREKFLLAATRAAIEARYADQARAMISDVVFAALDNDQIAEFNLLSGRIAEEEGRLDAALDVYGQVIATEVRPARAEAVYRTLGILDKQKRLDVVRGAQTLAAEALLWRGDALEASMQGMLADLYFRTGEYRQGFESVTAAVASDPQSREVQALSDHAQRMFNDLFLNGLADSIGPVEALGIYYDFRQLTPPGARGDEMIRNLARRLVRVDLLPQAADLLQYQLDNRLRGVARTEVASDLAVIYLAEHKPAEAMRVLNDTRLPDIPESLARQRRILEARALLDGGRDQLALDLVRDLTGQDVELMRIDAHWQAKRYAQAGQLIEALYGSGPAGVPLSKAARMGILQAGVGYALNNDEAGLARLRTKYSDAMVSSPEWPMFDYVTGPIQVTSTEFRQVASQIAAVNGLETFLAAYRDVYEGQGALTPLSAGGADGSGPVASLK